MAKILFTWELGMGLGHLMGIKSFCELLKGHELHLAAKDLRHVGSIFSGVDIEIHQAPFLQGGIGNPVEPAFCYSHILHNCGFSEKKVLSSLVRAWQNLFFAVKPDVVVFEHSPTALLAAVHLNFKKIGIGTGFTSPSPSKPMGLFFPDSTSEQGRNKLVEFECGLLKTLNEVLFDLHMSPLESLQSLFAQLDKSIVSGVPALDHFCERRNEYGAYVDYTGIPKPEKATNPAWPEVEGKRIFAYTHRFHKLPLLLSALKQSRQPSIVYSSSITHELISQFSAENLRFFNSPLDVDEISKTCSFAITNGNYNLSSQLLLRGIPLVIVPLHREQQIFANIVEKTGAGVVVDHRDNEDIIAKLNLVANSESFKRKAESFATELNQFQRESPQKLFQDVLNSIG
ncbi:hypothetical protein TDB9533_03492 [Thalassocella blandensis]|nr:hypothetical protein TDB9533_03492 [Thalassocella blandensis]